MRIDDNLLKATLAALGITFSSIPISGVVSSSGGSVDYMAVLVQIPIVAGFMIFAVALLDRFLKNNRERDAAFQKANVDRDTMMTKFVIEVQEKQSKAYNDAIERLADVTSRMERISDGCAGKRRPRPRRGHQAP